MPSRRRDKPSAARIDGLNPDDPGVRMLVEAARDRPAERCLLVCTGALAELPQAPRFILDVRELESGGRPIPWTDDVALEPGPELALVWPRAHLGRDFAEQCIARGGLLLGPGGTLLAAVRKQKGAESLGDFMGELFGNVRVRSKDRGYRLLVSDKGPGFDEGRARACLATRYTFEDPLLPGVPISTAPGVFSRQKLDAGTRCLIEHVAGRVSAARRVLDLCAGVAPLAIWAGRAFEQAHVLAVESNLVAVERARENVRAARLQGRVLLDAHDGLPAPQAWPAWAGRTDLALVNPPTHEGPAGLARLLLPLRAWLSPGAPAFVVAARPAQITGPLEGSGATVQVHEADGYGVVEVRFDRFEA